jgi:putative redox protein
MLLENDIVGTIGIEKYKCEIVWRNGTLIMDEPVSQGGKDLGPDPYTTFLASLAGCTLATLRMYIDRKEWPVSSIKISLNMDQSKGEELITTIDKKIDFVGDIDEEQRSRLLAVADKCPISKILSNSIVINLKS